MIASRGSGASVWRTAAVAAVCDHLQVGYWRTSTVRLHAGDFDERWDRADAVAQRFAARVMQLLPHGRRIRRWLWFTGFVRDRADRYKREWRRRLPSLSSKQLLRPIRLATHRSVKSLRKTTRQLWRSAH